MARVKDSISDPISGSNWKEEELEARKPVIVRFRRKEIRICQFNNGLFMINFRPLGLRVQENTLRQAFTKFGNALKRITNKELENLWNK